MDSVRIIEESRNLYSKTSKLLFIYHDDDDDDIKNAPKTYWQNEKFGGKYLKKYSPPTFQIFLTNDDDP